MGRRKQRNVPNLPEINLNKRKFPNTLGTLAWNVKIKINNIHILVSPFSKCLRWWVKLQNNERGNKLEKKILLLSKLMLANTSINIISIWPSTKFQLGCKYFLKIIHYRKYLIQQHKPFMDSGLLRVVLLILG